MFADAHVLKSLLTHDRMYARVMTPADDVLASTTISDANMNVCACRVHDRTCAKESVTWVTDENLA